MLRKWHAQPVQTIILPAGAVESRTFGYDNSETTTSLFRSSYVARYVDQRQQARRENIYQIMVVQSTCRNAVGI